MRPSLVVSIHDVAPSTAWAARAWVDELDRRHVPATLLVVPGPWEGPPLRVDRDLVAWLHERRQHGDEIAQHGGCAEFWSLDSRPVERLTVLRLVSDCRVAV